MIQLKPLRNATGSGRRHSQTAQRLYREELARVRAAALAWRNGLGALLAALLGFGLIRGRSDVGQLASPWHVVVGVLLAAALLVGAYAAVRLLWAAHGRPQVVSRNRLNSVLAADHEEAVEAQRSLHRGTVAAIACAGMLVTAVGTTWYGPARGQPRLEVRLPGEAVCGSVVRTAAGVLTVRTASGERVVRLDAAVGMRAVDSCKDG